MNKERIVLFKNIEKLFIQFFQFYIEDFSDTFNSKIVEDSKDLGWLEIIVLNNTFDKQLKFLISDGINDNKDKFNGLKFFIECNSSECQRSSFSIIDYCSMKNIEYFNKDFFINEQKLNENVEKYLAEIVKILEFDEIKELLFSKKWLEVPPDYSPYK
ncbi:hypothetical protein [Aquimarina megaterium]|uniref:hypothetical protein n=1 Tax=Aquimarina megaterium TaxID=1443666 RepID=UPI00047028FA|nr:hypothetical protein [Aquimarina megaterium]